MYRYLTRHLNDVGESYTQHFRHAASFGGWLALGAVVCLTHSVAPFLFEKTGSRIVNRLYQRMVTGRSALTPDHRKTKVAPAPLDYVI